MTVPVLRRIAKVFFVAGVFVLLFFAFDPAAYVVHAAQTVPPVMTGDATGISQTSANLGFSVDLGGSSPDLGLSLEGVEYVTEAFFTAHTGSYNQSFTQVPVYQNSGHGGSFGVNDLVCGTEYHYHAYVVTNDDQRGFGDDETFVTADCDPAPDIAADFDDGTGVPEDPYLINTCEQLQDMSEDVTASYTLEGPIDCSATNPDSESFDPGGPWADSGGFISVGDSGTPYTGVFDGNHFTISNLYSHHAGADGIFGGFNGTATDLVLSAPQILGQDDTGAFAGILGADGSITNVTVQGGSVTGSVYVGGLVGDDEGGSITNSSSAASVTGFQKVGGLVGHMDGGTISGAYATGDVTGTASGSYTGGFVGQMDDDASIQGAFASGDVEGVTSTGGFAGDIASGTISYASARGDVTAHSSKAGGFVGGNAGTISQAFSTGTVTGDSIESSPFSVGGFAGDQVGTVHDSFSAALVEAPDYIQVGGFAGYESGPLDNVGWWSQGYLKSLGFGSGTVVAKADREAWKVASDPFFSAWDFDDIWASSVGDYPRLNAGWPVVRAVTSGYVSEADDVLAGEYDGSDDSGDSGDGGDSGGSGADFAGGDGSDETPFLIDSCDQFLSINDALDASYLLTTNLDCTRIGNDVMVGGTLGGSSFEGTFDGGNHSLKVTIGDIDDPFIGFIRSAINATVKNLSISSGSVIEGGDATGSIIGAGLDTTLINVNSAATVISVSGSPTFPILGAGGIVGELFGGEIDGANFSGIVGAPLSAGGIAGLLANDLSSGPGGLISRSWNTGQVAMGEVGGGIVGYLFADSAVRNSYNAGPVSYFPELGDALSNHGGIGGIAGAMQGGTISRSYNSGALDDGTGTSGESFSAAGGIVGGMIDDATIVDSISVGAITGNAGTGSLIGALDGDEPVLFNNYFDSTLTGSTACVDGDSDPRDDCTDLQKGTLSYWAVPTHQPFPFWNFTDVWQTVSHNLPTLRAYISREPTESDDRADVDHSGDNDTEDSGDSDDSGDSANQVRHHVGSTGSSAGTILDRLKHFIDEKDPDALKNYVQQKEGLLKNLQEKGTTLPADVLSLLQTPTTIPAPQPALPTRDLTPGTIGDDVKQLQQQLNAHGFIIAASGAGSIGHETTLYGPLTKAAVKRFQLANGITPATGNVGPLTRAKLKALGWITL